MSYELADFADFEKLMFVSATITSVEDFERARKPSYKVSLDCGEYGTKQSSVQITHYNKQELLQKQVIVCLNLKPRNIAGFLSEVLVCGFYDDGGKCVLASIDNFSKIKNGSRLG